MTTRRVLLGLIVLMTVLLALPWAFVEDYLAAVLALGLGAIWLIPEINDQQGVPSFFFVAFLGLAVWGNLRGLPTSIMLAGLCLDLAAWDLSRFRARIANHLDPDTNLEAEHLQKLTITVGAGFVVALIPTLLRLSVNLNFGIFCLIVLVAMIMLRKAAISLRD